MSSTRPCRGPHRGEPPIVSTPLCDGCRRRLADLLERIPDMYVDAYLALEPGQRYDVRQETEHGHRRGKAAHAPLPIDVEADALMGRILEVVLSWHEVVVAAADLSALPTPRTVVTERLATRHQAVVETTSLPRLADETERGEFVAVRPVQRVEAVDRPSDSTAGVAITTACRTLAAHLDTLLALPATPLTRTVPRGQTTHTRRVPVPTLTDTTTWLRLAQPLLPDDTWGHVHADGRAVIAKDLDGVDAALELFALERDARRTLGQSRGATVFDYPCPACDEPGLVMLQGEDHVRCTACDERIAASDYDRLALVLRASGRSFDEAS